VAANDDTRVEPGWRILGLGIIAFAVIGFVWGDFISGQPAPKWLPERTTLAYIAAAFMLVTGAALQWRRTTRWAAASLIVYYGLIVLLLENGGVIAKNYAVYGAYFGVAEPLSIMSGALIIYAAANMKAARAARLTRAAQIMFGASAVFFGGAHFVYFSLTAPLIPTWLPPNQEFWAYATGVFHIMAGVAIITGIQARLGAILAAVMYALFIPLVFVPVLQIEPTAFRWTELATTVALIGVAWTVAESRNPR
jgi:hypothetical protein